MDGVAVMYASDSALQEFGRKAKAIYMPQKLFVRRKSSHHQTLSWYRTQGSWLRCPFVP